MHSLTRSFNRGLPTLLAAGAALMTTAAALAAGGNHFKATAPNIYQGDTEGLYSPLDFEAAAAAHPGRNSLSLYSRCRFAPFSTSTGLYAPITAPQSDAIVGDTTFAYADGTTCYNPQNEQNLVINPANPQNIVTSSNEYRGDVQAIYYSTDGGQSWTNVVLPGWTSSSGGQGVFSNINTCGDPVLAFSPDGQRLYFSGIACNRAPNGKNQAQSAIAVAVSTDGGAHWSAPTAIGYVASANFFNDKEWITVGPDGTVYLTWTRFVQGPKSGYKESPIVLSVSRNGGKSWSDLKPVSDAAHPYNQGSQPQVAPDGTLYVAYEGSTPSSGFLGDAIVVARSTDGGATFTNTEVARVYDDYNCYPIQAPGAQDRQTLTNEQFRINSFPSFAIDRTTGTLAIVWSDDRANASCGWEHPNAALLGPTSNQVLLVTSSDGTHWSAPRALTAGDSADKVFPAVAANGGRILVGYYTRSYSPAPGSAASGAPCGRGYRDPATGTIVTDTTNPVCLDYATRSSTDDYASEKRASRESSNPYLQFAGAFIGDYTGVALDSAGHGYAVWTDDRGNPGTTNPNQDAVVAGQQ